MQPDLFGVPPHKPAQSYRIPIYKIALVREAALTVCQPPHCRSSEQAVSVIRTYLAETGREHLLALTVDTKNRLIGINTVSVGSLSSSLGHPREIFKAAILQNAAAVILTHNHPSGDPTPSQEDRALTDRIKQAAELLGIRLLDHLIVGDGTERFFSFLDEACCELPARERTGGVAMYQPALREDQIEALYHLKVALRRLMTILIREAVDHYLREMKRKEDEARRYGTTLSDWLAEERKMEEEAGAAAKQNADLEDVNAPV